MSFSCAGHISDIQGYSCLHNDDSDDNASICVQCCKEESTKVASEVGIYEV